MQNVEIDAGAAGCGLQCRDDEAGVQRLAEFDALEAEELEEGGPCGRQHDIALTVGLTAISGWLAARYTSTPFPYLDAFTTWGSVAATLLMTRKVLECWVYWFIIDILIVVLTIRTGIPTTSVLYAVYVIMAVVGFISWRRSQLPLRCRAAGSRVSNKWLQGRNPRPRGPAPW